MSSLKSKQKPAEEKSALGRRSASSGVIPASSFIHVHPSECPIQGAIASLMNTRKVKDDDKSPFFDPAVLQALRGMFSSDRTYRFRMAKVSTLTNGTASLQVNVATDLTVYQEGTALAALFDECQLVATRWRLNLLTHTTQYGFVLGYEPIVTTATPSAATLVRLPCSCAYTTIFNDEKNGAFTLVYNAHRPLWGMCIDEGVAAPRLRSGLNGTFRIAHMTATITPTTSEVNFNYTLVTEARFRSRA